MQWIGDLFQWGVKQGQRAAEFIAKDGTGKPILTPSMEELAASAAYNRLASAAKPIIDSMDKDAAKEVIGAINRGEYFGTDAFEVAEAAMRNSSDEVQRAAAEEFGRVTEGYFEAAGQEDTIAAFASFLGRDDGKLGFINSVEGYFGDKRYGVRRIHTAVGAAAGVGVANRLLSGGSLTRTNTGERDIAGVPFF